jgi:hypothetical protein
MEPISTRTTPSYQKYLKLAIANDVETTAEPSQEAAGAKMTKNDETPFSTSNSVDPGYSKWKLIVAMIGCAPYFDSFTTGYDGKNGYVTEKNDDLFRMLLPGLGIRYKPSAKIALEANSRFVLGSAFAYAVSQYFTLETDYQFKYSIRHQTDNLNGAFPWGQINLGLGPAMNLNLFGGKSNPGFDLVKQAPSLQSRAILGGKASLEMEFNELFSLSVEFMGLANAGGKSIFGAGLYWKVFLPANPRP